MERWTCEVGGLKQKIHRMREQLNHAEMLYDLRFEMERTGSDPVAIWGMIWGDVREAHRALCRLLKDEETP